MSEPMNPSLSTTLNAPVERPINVKRVVLTATLVCVALILGGVGAVRVIAVLGNNWVLQEPQRIALAATAIIPAFLACGLFLSTARLLYSSAENSGARSRSLSRLATLVGLYGPFYWALTSDWWLRLPMLPGFTAGFFTKPLDNRIAFIAASSACTVLLVISLFVIGDRTRYGRFVAPLLALVISLITSYAAFSFMQA